MTRPRTHTTCRLDRRASVRRVACWGLRSIATACLGLWLVGLWGWSMCWLQGVACMSCGRGQLQVGNDALGNDYFTELAIRGVTIRSVGGLSMSWMPARGGWSDRLRWVDWTPSIERVPAFQTTPATWKLVMPLWIPFVCSAIPAVLCWRGMRRPAGGTRCSKCHYDRAGLGVGAVCPECGARPAP